MNDKSIFRKVALMCVSIPLAVSSHAANINITDASITEDISHPSDTVLFQPTQETGAMDYSISPGVTIEANYINFQRLGIRNPEDYSYTYVDINSVNIGSSSALKAANSITIGYNLGPTTSTGALFDVGYAMYVNSSWNSTNDTVNTARGFYLQGGTQTIDNLTLIESGGEDGQTTFTGGATVNISNSTLNMQGRLYVQGGANVTIKDSQTTLESHELSQISGGNLTVQGGKFTVVNSYQYSPRSFTVGGGSFVIDGAEVDTRGVVLTTRTSPSSRDAVITLKNGATLTAGTLDLYTYDGLQNTAVLNIESGSVANVETIGTYGRGMTGGTINVNNATLNIADNLIQAENNGSQVYTTNLNVTNGGSVSVEGTIDVSSAVIENATVTANEIVVEDGRTLSVVGTSDVTADLLSVYDGSSVSFSEDSTLNIDALEVVLSDLQLGSTYDLADIFGDDTSVVLAAVENTVTMGDFSGNSFVAEVSGTTITAVPEPSTYATIFGALALAFAAYRRRK